MKFSIVSAVVTGAVLNQVGASPLRVVVITSSQEISSNLRFGHAVPNHESAVAMMTHAPVVGGAERHSKVRHACGTQRLRQKAIELSNAFRHALGLPLIETDSKHGGGAHGRIVEIMPFIGTPPTMIEVKGLGKEGMTRGGDKVQTIHRHHHLLGDVTNLKKASFMRRLQHSIMTLGPWEGRAVAFVLGCGIGVLLRMIWVLGIVSYRQIRGESGEEHDYSRIVVEQLDAEENYVEPPTYTYPDEKTKSGVDQADTKPSTEEQK